jgi:hypothetical protein
MYQSKTMQEYDRILRIRMHEMLHICTGDFRATFVRTFRSVEEIRSDHLDGVFRQIETELELATNRGDRRCVHCSRWRGEHSALQRRCPANDRQQAQGLFFDPVIEFEPVEAEGMRR